MTAPAYCPHCGTALSPDAQFCPRCGQRFATAEVKVTPAHRWWVIAVPIAIIAIALIGWAILAGMPYGSQQSQVQTLPSVDSSNTVGENAQTTETVAQIGGTTTTTVDRGPVAMPSTQPPPPVAPPVVVEQQPPPPPAQTQTQAPPPPMASASTQQPTEISEDDAVSRLRDFLSRNNPYSTDADCVGLASLGERNRGYTIEVHDTCAPAPTTLGRWRVDAVTGEVFRQNDDGKYVKP